ncbi:Down syndrome cell adhesion molecule-like protein Dscam2 [Ixodes scapularis]|uniref:Down syndrome cell adhesion molecule-like protein Dscam2 n=1 Tax=Ixodes scapularis TaxID=6945 RepID=UPI001C388DCF|nr:Down syndrome cell adhesion molecule-like protein Dscam2 [Ixodes scapularis]
MSPCFKLIVLTGCLVSLLRSVCTNLVPPKIQPFAFPKTGTVGERSSVTCTTIAGDKPFKFVWLKDGLTLRQEGNVKIVSSSEFSVFNIEKLSLENAGNYTCVVSNAGGTVSYASTLEIKAPPTWKTEPRDMSVTAGQKASITCDGNGHPQPSVRWTKEGDRGSSDYRTKTIELPSASKQDQGSYTCEIANGIGEAIRKTITILVKCK